eukprot:CAMPEP_0119140754 /NCGR_PEP_ID=MMETSP1310-20130426/29810_1 /TAXON_ID=464262 /ORGANISM="Genus nov. species nov., Strain RCC2339" /LENGTH=39 /DNA_ID= /DNA_START= /DNA_END= /DNA_ORIENTATION=
MDSIPARSPSMYGVHQNITCPIVKTVASASNTPHAEPQR